MSVVNGRKPESVTELIGGYLANLFILLIVLVLMYIHADKFIAVWRVLRIMEFTIWSALTDWFDYERFKYGLHALRSSPRPTANWVMSFEADHNRVLRFFYSAVVIGFAVKMILNARKVTRQFNVQTMIEMYRHENEAIESLVTDNPLKHHRIFDWDNRDDYHNRHAQAISPEMMISACPPPLASHEELSAHKAAIAKGEPSPSRPITIIDRATGSFNFSREDARVSLERQLTKVPVSNGFYTSEDYAPRLFDEHGEVVPLSYDQSKKKIIGGFSKSGLLNNGRDFNGHHEDVRYLFNGTEREVFEFLCMRYAHPTVALADTILALTKRHAFTRTYLVALLNIVRRNELVASTEFYMLQRRDRGLYFALYSASEEKPFYEALGVMCHYNYEIKVGQKLVNPIVKNAIDTLQKDSKRVASWQEPTGDLLAQISNNMLADTDLTNSRFYTDVDDATLGSLLETTHDQPDKVGG